MSRPRCSVFIAVSLDGCIARADGGIDWLERVALPGEDYGYQAFFDSVDALVIGRKTYDVAKGFEPWPYRGKQCVVMTRQALTAQHDETFFAGEPAALLEKLGAAGLRHVYVDGGSVIQQFLAARLIDSLTLSVVPLILGDGIRLFSSANGELGLKLTETRSWSSGLVQLRYECR